MLRSVLDMLRQLMPADGEIKFLNRFQYRALKPTWPVAFSLLFLGLAFLVPDQGRAIIKYTIDRASFDLDTSVFDTLILIALFVVHGSVMMYTAFMLSAVTRRSQMDAETEFVETVQRDPVDPSISLRLRYAYWCGVFLPLLFMLMGFWFQYGLVDLRFWGVVAAGLLFGVLCSQGARLLHGGFARKRTKFNQMREKPGIALQIQYTFYSLIHFCIAPEHRNAQAAIVALILVLSTLTAAAWFVPEFYFPGGAWMFFICFLSLHLIFRYYKDRIVRLHQGHTARYIIIDPFVERFFRWVRFIGILFIPLVFWFPPVVDFLGPLGVGLFGTLWGTLFFSGLVESAARHVRADEGELTDAEKTKTWSGRRWDEFQSMRRSYSAKSWFFLFLIGLLFIELLVSSLEVLLFEPRLTPDMLIFLILLGVFVFRRRIWSNRVEFRSAINRLPSASVLAPILLLGLGEAHHIHRLAAEPVDTEFEAHNIETHAADWLAARVGEGDAAQTPIPAIIVLAEGGGIRAGAHAGYYLSRLDSALMNHCNEVNGADAICASDGTTRLLDHVYSINGVSGGAVGSAVYLAAVKEELANGLTASQRHDIINETLKSDFLSPLFAGLFGSDALTTIIPAQISDRVLGLFDRRDTDAVGEYFERGIYDRADFFENRLANVFDRALLAANGANDETARTARVNAKPWCRPSVSARGQRTMDQTLESVARCAVRPSTDSAHEDPGPMVFFSSFYETGGYQMATANVDVFSGQSGAVGSHCGSVPIVQQMIDRVEPVPGEAQTACAPRTKTLPLSTAAHLSARFPVSNPTGVVETRFENGRWKRHYFVDGGYMDNSGSLTAIQSVEALRDAARDADVSVNVIVLHLYALSIPSEAAGQAQRGQRATKQNEFASIPSAVLKARGAASRAPIRLLCNSLLDHSEDELGPAVCDEIFDRRIVSGSDAGTFTTEAFNARASAVDLPDIVRCPVDPGRNEAIVLNALPRTSQSSDSEPLEAISSNPIQAASWIPVPLEVAASDRQTNAITALLGWSLLEETTRDMNAVMQGTANITLNEISRMVAADARNNNVRVRSKCH